MFAYAAGCPLSARSPVISVIAGCGSSPLRCATALRNMRCGIHAAVGELALGHDVKIGYLGDEHAL